MVETTATSTNAYANASCLMQDLAKKIKEMASIISKWWSGIQNHFLPGKWLHYARYSKKARIRKKYNDKIQRFWKGVIKLKDKEGLDIG